ncbi:MAG TPA: SRPBCC domain-containing protein [Acidimicrobiia bacterium]|nr:SRPBCC domain-containing protein [Acidimicrobiia bacterium]
MTGHRPEDGNGAGEPGAVRRSVVLPAPVGAVWAALTGAESLSAWLGGDVELDPFPGGQIVVKEDGRLRRGVIVDIEPSRHLEIRWLPASRRVGFLWGPDEEPPGSGGAVEFWLEPAPWGDGTAAGEVGPAGAAGAPGATCLTVIERPPAPQPVRRPSAQAVA